VLNYHGNWCLALTCATLELSTEKAFLKRILESDARPLPRETPVESEEYKARNATLKGLTAANVANEGVVEGLLAAVGQAGAYTRPLFSST